MIDRQALMRISAESLCDLRTVTKAYEGQPVTMASRARICKAAEFLNLDMPPEPAVRWRAP